MQDLDLIAGIGTVNLFYASGIQTASSANTINRFTLVNNTIVASARSGIDIALQDPESRLTLANSIIVGSKGSLGDLGDGDLGLKQAAQITISNCLLGVDRRFNSIGRNGNISSNPGFADQMKGNYRLTLGSPAIDAGDNIAVGDIRTDLDGNPRIVDAYGDGTAIVDIGAYEFQPGSVAQVLNRTSTAWGGSHGIGLRVMDRLNLPILKPGARRD